MTAPRKLTENDRAEIEKFRLYLSACNRWDGANDITDGAPLLDLEGIGVAQETDQGARRDLPANSVRRSAMKPDRVEIDRALESLTHVADYCEANGWKLTADEIRDDIRRIKAALYVPPVDPILEEARALAGMPVCPCCGKRHGRPSNGNTGPR